MVVYRARLACAWNKIVRGMLSRASTDHANIHVRMRARAVVLQSKRAVSAQVPMTRQRQ